MRQVASTLSDEEIENLLVQQPPDPEIDAALKLLTDAELEKAFDSDLSRDEILRLAAARSREGASA